MKRPILSFIAAAFAAAVLAGCADANGLHNQEAAMVTFVFENVSAPDGAYSLPGEWQSAPWDNTVAHLELTGGKGTSEPQTVTVSSFVFSLVPFNGWERPWYPAMKGNAWDTNSGGNQWNFEITGLPLGQAVTVTVDGSSSPASITIE